MRHNAKVKSQMPNPTATPAKTPVKMFKSPGPDESNKVVSFDDVRSHVQELKEEWKKAKKSRNASHIKMLLKETLQYRDNLLQKSQRLISGILDEFPCFSDAIYVSFLPPSY